jgi:hypothetical protein
MTDNLIINIRSFQGWLTAVKKEFPFLEKDPFYEAIKEHLNKLFRLAQKL